MGNLFAFLNMEDLEQECSEGDIGEARLQQERDATTSSFRLMNGALINGNFGDLMKTADARLRVADALGWPVGAVQLLTMSGGTIIRDEDPLPKEGEDEVMVVVDSQVVRAYVDGFMDGLPKDDPPSRLMFAVLTAKVDAVRMLLLDGHDPNEVDEQRGGQTPLHAAAQNSSFHSAKICRLLLDAKAEPGVSNKKGLSPLHIATKTNSQEVARALLNGGADRHCSSGLGEPSPTQLALASRNIDLVEVFSEHVLWTKKASFILPELAAPCTATHKK
jgi:hypothetical protein